MSATHYIIIIIIIIIIPTFLEVEPCTCGQVCDPGIGRKANLITFLNHRRQCKHRLQVLTQGRVASGRGGAAFLRYTNGQSWVFLQCTNGQSGVFLQGATGERGAFLQGASGERRASL